MFLWLQYALCETRISLKKITKLVFGQKSEKQNCNASGDIAESKDDNKPSGVSQASDDGKATSNSKDSSNSSQTSSNQTGVSGRLGMDAYTGAETIHCSHPEHKRGDICPQCDQGSLFKMKDPGTEIRLFSQGLIQAIIYFLERYRCSACGAIFKAPMPEDVVNKKYDDSAKVTLAIMHYYMGLPFKRIELYQQMTGNPLPDATQFELVESVADVGYRIYEYLKHCAADSQLAYHDDTTARILSMIKENQQAAPKRKAMYTTAMVFEGEHSICLYVNGRQHAGENLDDIIDCRDETLEPIILK